MASEPGAFSPGASLEGKAVYYGDNWSKFCLL